MNLDTDERITQQLTLESKEEDYQLIKVKQGNQNIPETLEVQRNTEVELESSVRYSDSLFNNEQFNNFIL